MKTKCSRCGGQDSGCYVCKPETNEAPEWPTREDVEEMRVQAQEVLKNNVTGTWGVSASVAIAEDGELRYQACGYVEGKGNFLTSSGSTPEAAIELLTKRAESESPVTKLKDQAKNLGFKLTKIKP
jgi:hypothetical protein